MISPESANTKNRIWLVLETNWAALVWLLFGVVVVLRLVNLSKIPISENEAELALIAARIAKGHAGMVSELPLYTGLSAILFFVFGDSEFWLRILPIIAGCSLVFIPALWRDRLDFDKVFLLSLALAVIPTVTYYSRTIDSPIFATSALIWFISLLHRRSWTWSGVAAACLWLSGSLALPITILVILGYFLIKSQNNNTTHYVLGLGSDKAGFNRFCSAMAIALVVISTSFLLNITGLGGLGSFFTSTARNFENWTPTELARSAFLLLHYNLIPLILFFWGWIKQWRSTKEPKQAHSLYLILATVCLVFSLINPKFQLPFSLLVWIMGISALGRNQELFEQKRNIYLPLVVFGIALLVYVSIVAKTWSNAPYNGLALGLAAIAGVILFILAHGFVGLGWSTSVAKQAAFTSIGVILVIGTLAGNFRFVLAEPKIAALQWQNTPVFTRTILPALVSEFQALSNFKQGELNLKVETNPTAPYEWMTRDLTNLRALPKSNMPGIIITSSDKPGNQIESNYRGMSIATSEAINWTNLNLKQFVVGILGMELPVIKQFNYLWVEKSFFTGN